MTDIRFVDTKLSDQRRLLRVGSTDILFPQPARHATRLDLLRITAPKSNFKLLEVREIISCFYVLLFCFSNTSTPNKRNKSGSLPY